MRAARMALSAALFCIGASMPAGAGALFWPGYYYGGPSIGFGGLYVLPAPLTPRVAYPYPAVIGYSPALYYAEPPVYFYEPPPYGAPVAAAGCVAQVKAVAPNARRPVRRTRCSR